MFPPDIPILAPRMVLGDGPGRVIMTDLGMGKIRIYRPSGEGGDFSEDELRRCIIDFVNERL